ncbi:efflux RND transporter periplasmic adaptor subunit [Alloacidobacterium dinghuense]|uniref:Efflux RND transporter periplasmic adaptor subunit n=1 Tax=Alloacidobacterium dinghuense TaxID=2763107 RepID=A0A7G8BJ48_9BACT|nr:efflux RND transporter periplasmic adaptor subunit [Alloacidobacterium dinghuense]QNI32568.1 efflux RND transporter periplasmic adaptor subunit [Alloacidobacterium dinghuense]
MEGKNILRTSPMVPRANGKKLLWFLVIPCLLCVLGLITLRENAQGGKVLAANTHSSLAIPVNVIQANQGEASNEIVLPATLQAYDESPVYARTNGYVRKWYVDIGQRVKSGELLAVIDAPEVDQQLLRARAMLSQSQANLTLAAVTAKRYQELIADNSVAQQQVDQNNQNLAAQQANVAAASADVANLEQQQIYEKVIAPFDGIVTERHTDIGDLINAGNSGPGAELFRVSRTSTMRIFIPVPEEYSQQIHDGMHVSVELTELPGQRFDGQVTRSTESINVSSRTLMVEVDVPNPAGKLLPGAYAQVHIKLFAPTRPLLVPAGSILFQSAGPQIAVVTAEHQIELRKVTIGSDFGNTVEITSGITAQDSIVANPPDYLVDGMPVTIQGHSGNAKGQASHA